MERFRIDGQALIWRCGGQTLYIEPWGPDCLRVRCTEAPEIDARPMALVAPSPASSTIELGEREATLTNGRILARVADTGWTRLFDAETGAVLLEEEPTLRVRHFRSLPGGGDRFRIEARFGAYDGNASSAWASTPTDGSTARAA